MGQIYVPQNTTLAASNFAAPTAPVGLVSSAGVLLTALRSDAGLVIDQTIAPTWTGLHTWASANGSVAIDGDSPFIVITGTVGTGPHIDFIDNSAAVNARKWRDYEFAGSRFFDVCRDDNSVGRLWLQVDRSLDSINALRFGNATNNPTFTFLGSGAMSIGGTVNIDRAPAGVAGLTVGQVALGDSIFYAVDTATGASLRVGYNGTPVNYYDADTHNIRTAGGAAAGGFDDNAVAGNTRFMVFDVDNNTLERVSVGVPDSGGVGFKLLRIPN